MYKEAYGDAAKGCGFIPLALGVLLVIFLFVGIFAVASGEGQIWWNNTFGTKIVNSETNIIHQSNQYTTTGEQGLVQKLQSARDIDVEIAQATGNTELISSLRAQQKAIITSMKVTIATLPQDQVQQDIPEVAAYLASH